MDIYVHFGREEHTSNLRGKREDDLVRTHRILGRATGDSVVVMNESSTSTMLDDARLLPGGCL